MSARCCFSARVRGDRATDGARCDGFCPVVLTVLRAGITARQRCGVRVRIPELRLPFANSRCFSVQANLGATAQVLYDIVLLSVQLEEHCHLVQCVRGASRIHVRNIAGPVNRALNFDR